MPLLIFGCALAAGWWCGAYIILSRMLLPRRLQAADLARRLGLLRQECGSLKAGIVVFEREICATMELYEITRDLCATLDEERVFEIFKERLGRTIRMRGLRILKEDADPATMSDSEIIPLKVHKRMVGYLAAEGVEEHDREKFHIMAQQFLMGYKRAVLYHRIQDMAISDALTGGCSRRYFFERLKEELARSHEFKHCLSFLLLDIDHFKDINDQYGHLVGDAVLRRVGAIIRENIRQVDFMGRYGGEELAIALAETGKEAAYAAAQRIRQAVESQRIAVYDEELSVTISIGAAVFPDDAAQQESLVEKADAALYRAKSEGRNRVCCAPDDI